MAHKPRIKPFFPRVFPFLGLVTISVLSASPEENTDSTTRLHEVFLGWKLGMLIHYNIATYNDRQWATSTEEPATFRPDKFDCNQWLESARLPRG